jgi:general secretion pathway protein A
MYNEYFGFKEAPFSIAPDPRYLYMTAQHREALAHLVYGLNSEGGCILLTGEVGTGKTTVCRCLLEQIPAQAKVALVLNPRVSAIELLETICDELKISYPGDDNADASNTVKTYIDRINRFLIAANARNEKTVLIIDEAQNLDSSVLEQLRLLTNLETNKRKLLQIIILGQPELLDILARPEMRQLAQRITARFHLNALNSEEVRAYIAHRLAVAGQNVQLFPEATMRRLFRLSKGIPRLINILCDRALLGCYVQNIYCVDTRTLNTAANEVFGELKNVETRQQRRHWPLYIIFLTVLAGSAALAFWYSQKIPDRVISDLRTGDTAALTTADAGSTAAPEDATTDMPANAALAAVSAESEASVSAAATAPVTDPLQVFISQASETNKADAYQALFALWKQKYSERLDKNACSFAELHGLSCLHRQGNLNSIRQINAPVILQVYNTEGGDASVTLSRLDENRAVLLSGEKEFSVSVDTLESHWYGEYSLLWKTPPYYSDALQVGDSGPVVQWLDQQLARLLPDSKATIRDNYTEAMAARVTEFQRSVGLPADGIAGPMTFIYLNTALAYDTPHLLTTSSKAP